MKRGSSKELSSRRTSLTRAEAVYRTLMVLDPVRPDPRFRQVRLEVDTKTAQVLKSTVVDPDGSENAISFLDLKTNVGIAADSFKINPPEGTRVEDFTKQTK